MAHDHSNPPSDLLRRIASESERSNTGLLIGCDANAHHTQWGSSDINVRGESLFSFILNSNMVLCNQGNDPTFIIKNRQEVIDLTLVSHNILGLVKGWRVLEEHSFSDHRYIETIISLECPTANSYINPRKANWEIYSKTLEELLPPTAPTCPDTQDCLNSLVNRFTEACNNAFKAACPSKKPSRKKKPPWRKCSGKLSDDMTQEKSIFFLFPAVLAHKNHNRDPH
ncbi:uncharacterized protein LOC117898569 [Drosophila subobscura]|uniref:uncharacterized protein LOC117898569 n=1 Tax=Drosophila subobscura TaxID=7241 RepID=UPI00155B2C77|nr:uncharacterized protein LOC117898569 [Drosophila subobscura]